MDKRIALVDSDSLLFICLYNKKDEIPKSLEQCKEKIDLMIWNILSVTKATHYILTLTIGKNFRYKVREDYKANRKSDRPDYFYEVRQYLIDKYKAQFNEYTESDDIVNIYKNNLSNSFICACDSDILEGLEGIHFDYKKFKWITTSKDEANYKFWVDMIAGTHNGVSGLKGKGAKYAEKAFEILKDKRLNNVLFNHMNIVLDEYIKHYNDMLIGMEEFYKNVKCLKILDKYDGLVMIEPIEFNKYEEEYKLVD